MIVADLFAYFLQAFLQMRIMITCIQVTVNSVIPTRKLQKLSRQICWYILYSLKLNFISIRFVLYALRYQKTDIKYNYKSLCK